MIVVGIATAGLYWGGWFDKQSEREELPEYEPGALLSQQENAECTTYEANSGVRVSLRWFSTQEEADEACAELAQELSGTQAYWQIGIPPLPEEEPVLVCNLHEPERNATIFVEQMFETFLSTAQSLCGQLVSVGWEQISPSVYGPGAIEWGEERALAEQIEAEEVMRAKARREQEEIRSARIQRREEEIYESCAAEVEDRERQELEEVRADVRADVETMSRQDEIFDRQNVGYDEELRVEVRADDALVACDERATQQAGGY